MTSADAKRILETALLCAQAPMPLREMRVLFDDQVGADTVRMLLDEISRDWEQRGIELVALAGGWRFQSRPEMREYLDRLHPEKPPRYSRAAMETLAIIAYKQPILRAEIEAIRGVACGETIRNLMEKHVVKIAGRAEEPGRPILYGTTRRFLEVFGLNSIKDLPQPEAGAGVADASRNLQSRIEPVTDEPSPAARPADAPSQLAEAENQAAEFQAAESQVPPADANDHAL